MSDFYQKRKFKKVLYSPVVLVPLVVVVFFVGTSVWNVYTKNNEANSKREQQMVELEGLKARAAALKAEIERLSTEKGKEAEIRSKFEVSKKGEHLIVIVDPKKEEKSPEVIKKRNLWQQFLDWF